MLPLQIESPKTKELQTTSTLQESTQFVSIKNHQLDRFVIERYVKTKNHMLNQAHPYKLSANTVRGLISRAQKRKKPERKARQISNSRPQPTAEIQNSGTPDALVGDRRYHTSSTQQPDAPGRKMNRMWLTETETKKTSYQDASDYKNIYHAPVF